MKNSHKEGKMGIIDSLKLAVDALKQSGKVDVIQDIIGAQSQIIELMDENKGLKNQLEDCKEKLKIKGSINFDLNAYWLTKEDGEKEGPYCSLCYDSNKKLIHLIPSTDSKHLMCPKCKRTLEIKR